MRVCKNGYELNDDGAIPVRCHVDWDGDFYPTVCKECPHYENMGTEEVDKIINQLFDIATELDARNIGANCVIPELTGVGWTDLCEMGIELFKQIK